MNERIRELANIAAGRNIKTSPAVASDMADWAVIEKFAELIVKECGVALSPMLRDMISRGQAYDLIKRHFGVES